MNRRVIGVSLIIALISIFNTFLYGDLASAATIAARNRYPQNRHEVSAVANANGGCNFNNTNIYLGYGEGWWPWGARISTPYDINKVSCHSASYIRTWFIDRGNTDKYADSNVINASADANSVDLEMIFSVFVNQSRTTHITNIKAENGSKLSLTGGINHASPDRGKVVTLGQLVGRGFVDPKLDLGSIIYGKLDISDHPGGAKDYVVKYRLCNYNNVAGYTDSDALARANSIGMGCDWFESTLRVNKPVVKYQTDGKSYIKTSDDGGNWGEASREISTTVGRTIQFRHELKNIGDASNYGMGNVVVRANDDYQAVWGNSKPEIGSWATGVVKRNNVANGGVFARASADGGVVQLNAHPLSYTIKQSDLGRKLCSRIEWTLGERNMSAINQPPQQNITGSGIGYTGWACAYVAYENELFPCVAGGGNACGGNAVDVEATQQITAVPSIENRGTTKSPNNTKWKVSAWVMPEANELSGVPSQFDIANGSPCASYAAKFGVTTDVMVNQWKCKDDLQDGGSSIGNGATQTLNSQTQTIPADAKIGSRFCYAVSVSPAKLDSGESQAQQNTNMNTWRYSQPLCYKVVKKPKIQVWGNGVYAENGIQTSTSEYNGGAVKSASWGEFEAMSGLGGSKHGIRGFKSGSSVTETKLNFGEETKGWSNLPSMKDELVANIKNRFKSGSADVYVGNITSATATAPLLNSVPRKTRVIYANDLWIRNNINQNSVDQQTIIIAKNIRIAGNVTNVDAWLIADNIVNTCADGHFDNSDDVKIANCSQPLQINGVVMAKELKAWRVGKSDAQTPNEPSEIINQRPSMYLWAQDQAQTVTNSIKTTYTRELPVRY